MLAIPVSNASTSGSNTPTHPHQIVGGYMTTTNDTRPRPKLRAAAERAENIWEDKIIFGARWLLAPAYGVLVLVLAVLAYKAVEEFWELLVRWRNADEARAIAQVLVIVDIVLVMNLVLMMLFVGYQNFVSRVKSFDEAVSVDAPSWLGLLDYSGLKIQLIGSIIAISGIMLLRVFVDMLDAETTD